MSDPFIFAWTDYIDHQLRSGGVSMDTCGRTGIGV